MNLFVKSALAGFRNFQQAHTYLKVLGLLLSLAIPWCAAQAAPFPDGVVRIVVPTTAGGPADLAARLLAGKLAESLGTQVIVENKAGANGTIATDFVAKAPAGGQTLLIGTGAFTINSAIYRKLPYSAAQDFVPLAMLVSPGPLVLVAHPSLTVKTVAELVARAKTQSKPFAYGSAGIGNTTHLGGEMFGQLAGVKFDHIPYKGMSAGLNDLLSGQVSFMFLPWSSVERFVKDAKLNALAQTGVKRMASLPDLPTMAEAGIKGYELTGWIGVFARTGTPPEVIKTLNAAVVKAMVEPDVYAKLAALGSGEPPRMTPEQMAAFVRNDFKLMEQVAKAANLSLEVD